MVAICSTTVELSKKYKTSNLCFGLSLFQLTFWIALMLKKIGITNRCLVMIWSVNRLHKVPEFLLDLEKHDPSRCDGDGPQPYTSLAFGSGPHTCQGIERFSCIACSSINNFSCKKK